MSKPSSSGSGIDGRGVGGGSCSGGSSAGKEAGARGGLLGLHLLGQPPGELVERDDVVAVILERRRRDRQAELALRRQEVDVVLTHFLGERRALGDEVGNQVTQRRRIEECAR